MAIPARTPRGSSAALTRRSAPYPSLATPPLPAIAFLTGGSWNNPITIQTDRRIVTGNVNINAVSSRFFLDPRHSHPCWPRLRRSRLPRRPAKPAVRSVIVNEAFVKRYLAGRDPLGIPIGEGSGPDVKPDIVIVGVCGDFNYRGLRDDSEQAFFPMFEGDDAGATFYINTRGTPEQAIPSIRNIVRQADPRLPILWFRT